MSTASTSVEASLLFADQPAQELSLFVPEIKRHLAALGVPARQVRCKSGEHVLLHCDRVQVLLALCTVPFDADDFEGAIRPADAIDEDARLLRELRNHRASVTILVADRPGAEGATPLALKERICWDLSGYCAGTLGARVVFWSEGDTLYTAQEFLRAHLHVRAPVAPVAPHWALRDDDEDDLGFTVGETLLASLAAHAGTASARPTCSSWERVSRGLPAEDEFGDEEEFLDDAMVRKGTTYGLIAILAAMSAPVAIGALVYNVFRGENAHMVAQLVAVTALGLAITWASLHEKAFFFL